MSSSSTNTPKLPISVFVVTLNEQAHLEKLLKSVEAMDEVVLVDSGSTDRTLDIARHYGAQIHHQDWMGFAKQKHYAMSLCRNEWVLNLDGDEELNSAIIARFRQVIEANNCDSVRLRRNNFFMGKRPSRFTKLSSHVRLFRKSKAKYDSSKLVHESAIVEGKELFIDEVFDHYGYDCAEVLADKNNQYSSLKAQEKFSKGNGYSTLKLVLIFPLTFIKKYLIQGYIFSGRRGFILAMIDAHYAFMKEVKLYEIYQQHPLDKQVSED